ncbi:hypothetical protein [Modestobacter italicus]|uniref:hypothetical protein n=1 Tax=Modestobacter italicus (strain DSM 44449 / CECT 9708 / BC 501) TaxID=2732864 RepID=UPI0002FE731E|nr:hypothetical protein [Modestobacter marinus]
MTAPDYENSIPSDVVRCVWRGQRTVAVGADPAQQLAGVIALVDLHARLGGQSGDRSVSADDVTVLVAEMPRRPETIDAVATLAATATAHGGPRVHVAGLDGDGRPTEVPAVAVDFADAAAYGYAPWAEMLMATRRGPSRWVDEFLAAVEREDVRAYPMLSSRGARWSLRLEGLQFAVADAAGAVLDVGADGKNDARSEQRRQWVAAAGTEQITIAADGPWDRAIMAVRRLADTWLPSVDVDAATAPQNEHVLESRILRGACPVVVDGRPLDLIDIAPGRPVSWGSQFPTRWGRRPPAGNGRAPSSARYLDALLRDGTTPWAVEMKVQGTGGVGQYYRNAVAQAVLYQRFIATAESLDEWFRAAGLDRTAVRSAVVVPRPPEKQQKWIERLEQVCGLFGVAPVVVDPSFAERTTGRPLAS